MSRQFSKDQHQGEQTVDFDMCGSLGIRLIGPTQADLRTVRYQLGLRQQRLNRAPDLVLRFSPALEAPGLKYLGLDSTAFNKDDFFLMTGGNGRVRPVMQIPFEHIGEKSEIVCVSGQRWLPMLNLIVVLTLLKKGFAPLHAAAFRFNRTGCLVAGWATGGKTEVLLAFAKHGAQYIGDEWVFISPDGKEMFGMPAPTSIKEWQFPYISNLLPQIGLKKRMLFTAIHSMDRLANLLDNGKLKRALPTRALKRFVPILKKEQLKIWVTPRKFFKAQFSDVRTSFDKLFLIMMDSASEVSVQEADASDIARRMVHSNMYELQSIMQSYLAYRFAFPEHRNAFLDDLSVAMTSVLGRALAGKDAYQVYRPYPTVSLDALFEHISPVCAGDKETSSVQTAAQAR